MPRRRDSVLTRRRPITLQGYEPPPRQSRAAVLRAIRRHSPKEWQKGLAEADVRALTQGSVEKWVYVVTADIRKSTLLMKEAVRPDVHAKILDDITKQAKSKVLADGGWFDKFTGDGYIAYWLFPAGGGFDETVFRALQFADFVISSFDGHLTRFRRNSRNVPIGVGVSVGLDAGPAHLVVVGGDLTVVGAPIVGARRMVEAADASQVLANVHLGEFLEYREKFAGRLRPTELKYHAKRISVNTKEYSEGQEAFEIVFTHLSSGRSA